jgi:RNA polymerase sigma factor (sigma-70 family)
MGGRVIVVKGSEDEPLFSDIGDVLSRTASGSYEREPRSIAELKLLARVPARLAPQLAKDFMPETLVAAYRACVERQLDDVGCRLMHLLCRRIGRYVGRRLANIPWRDSEERDDAERELMVTLVSEWQRTERSVEFWEVRFWKLLGIRLVDTLRRVRRASTDACRGRVTTGEEELPDPDAPDVGPYTVTRVVLQHLLDSLPGCMRDVLIMKYVDRRTEREIADCLGVTERTVRNMTRRALDQMRKGLEEDAP